MPKLSDEAIYEQLVEIGNFMRTLSEATDVYVKMQKEKLPIDREITKAIGEIQRDIRQIKRQLSIL